ncbi:MAG: YlbF family regulator [Planctomycetota bacterium]
MPADEQEIMDLAKKLGDLVAEHPAIKKMADAQKSVAEDAEAGKMLGEFEQKIAVVSRNEQMGQPVTPQERAELESLQQKIASNLKVQNLDAAQVDFTALLRKVSQAWQQPIAAKQQEGMPQQGQGGAGGPDLGAFAGGIGG